MCHKTKPNSFVYIQLNGQTVIFLTIRFNLSHLFAHSLKDHTVLFDPYIESCTTTPGQNGPDSIGNVGLLRIPKGSKTGASPSACLVSYPGTLFGRKFYPSAEMQLVYSTVPVDWAEDEKRDLLFVIWDRILLKTHIIVCIRVKGSLFDVVANMLVCDIIVSKFDLQSLYVFLLDLFPRERN